MNTTSEVGAFFDLDGTLLPSPSLEIRFLRFAICRGAAGPIQPLSWVAGFLREVALDPHAATLGNKAHFSGVSTRAAQRWAERLAARPTKLFSAGLRLLEWHAARGHRIFLVTGAPAPLAEILVRRLPFPVEFIATELEERNGHWTGKVLGEHMSGNAKERAIERISAATGIALSRSFAYGNSYSDVPMLETVAFPTVINPTELLERLAHLRGWPVLEWHATESQREAVASSEIAGTFERRAPLISAVHPSFGVSR